LTDTGKKEREEREGRIGAEAEILLRLRKGAVSRKKASARRRGTVRERTGLDRAEGRGNQKKKRPSKTPKKRILSRGGKHSVRDRDIKFYLPG